MRERFQGRDIERVERIIGRALTKFGRAEVGHRWQEPRECLSRTGIRDEQRVFATARGVQHFGLVPPHAPIAASKPCGNFGRNFRLRSDA
jgi:hypothetical protein